MLIGLPDTPIAGQGALSLGRPQRRWGAWWDQRPRCLRALALLALIWMLGYLIWRVLYSWHGASPYLAVPLLATELFGFWNLLNLTWFSWDPPRADAPAARPDVPVDIYVCTYDEPDAVVRATLIGCEAVRYPHTTYLLDDGRRPGMQQLAAELGAEYVTRPDNEHAKAGNINHALSRTHGDLVLMLDADHVPLPGALDALVGYFEDPEVALVQTPHDFYNHDSVQHYEIGRHEQSVFYSVILPGKDRHGGAFWCGSAALIRRQALIDAGGVAVETIAEDFHTTIKLQRAGWKTRYHDEVLVQGLAPQDLAAYLLQRDRWARGNLAVFATPESPLRARELSLAQRFSYFASLSSYLAGPVRLLGLATLTVTLWTGLLPLRITPLTLAVLWGPATLLSLAGGSALCRGYQGLADTGHFELCTAEIYLRALRCILRPGRTCFKVTPKDGVDYGGWGAVRLLRMVTLISVLLAIGITIRILQDSGVFHPLPALHGMALWVVPVIAAIELRRALRTLAMVWRHRQLRTEYRVPLTVPAAVRTGDEGGQLLGRLADISAAGLRLVAPGELQLGTIATVAFNLPAVAGAPRPVQVNVKIVSCRHDGEAWVAGTLIAGADLSSRRSILEYVHVVSAQRRLSHLAAATLQRTEDARLEAAHNLQIPTGSTRLEEAASQSIVAA